MILNVASTLRFDFSNSYSYFRIHTSKTYKDMGNVKLLNVVEVGLDLFITLKNASPHTWNLCFPILMMPMSVRGYNKPTCLKQKKYKCFIYFKNNFKTPKL